MIVRGSREDAIRALINTWLKDPALRCGWCGVEYNKLTHPCCEQPFIGTNFDILKQFQDEMAISRNTRKNEFAATDKSKRMRWKLSFPPSLLEFLTITFKRMYNENLFNDKYGTTWFARKFRKYFTVPERI
jgi:hypothetical protein